MTGRNRSRVAGWAEGVPNSLMDPTPVRLALPNPAAGARRPRAKPAAAAKPQSPLTNNERVGKSAKRSREIVRKVSFERAKSEGKAPFGGSASERAPGEKGRRGDPGRAGFPSEVRQRTLRVSGYCCTSLLMTRYSRATARISGEWLQRTKGRQWFRQRYCLCARPTGWIGR